MKDINYKYHSHTDTKMREEPDSPSLPVDKKAHDSKPDIERLKNYLSPIFNYFELLREKPEHTFEEAEICYGVLPKIKKELGLCDL